MFFGPKISKEPRVFEVRIFIWVFLPILLLGVFFTLYKATDGKNKCEKICLSKNFAGFRYTPSGRYGIEPEHCTCLTKENMDLKSRIPTGKREY